jgi:hypothetical protein
VQNSKFSTATINVCNWAFPDVGARQQVAPKTTFILAYWQLTRHSIRPIPPALIQFSDARVRLAGYRAFKLFRSNDGVNGMALFTGFWAGSIEVVVEVGVERIEVAQGFVA